MENPQYELELRIDGTLIGDCRRIAQGLKWTRRRTMVGIDEIDFTLNDVIFESWLNERNTTITDILRPLALECRVVRNGVELVGGFLATMPAYSPNGTSSNLAMKFDGYENLLAGVYIYPTAATTAAANSIVDGWIQLANTRSSAAGKSFGFVAGTASTMSSTTITFDGYKTIKDAISDRCDNTTGAGKFDIYWHADRTYDIVKDSEFGTVHSDYVIQYPTMLNGVSATSISASEVSGFASSVIGIGAGETSSDSTKSTAITSLSTNSSAVATYGYAETLVQDSSISTQSVLDTKVATYLKRASSAEWQPQIVLTGRQIAPVPSGAVSTPSIWLADTIVVNNTEDLTGMTSGSFRVQELAVDVSATNAETITPTLERVDAQ